MSARDFDPLETWPFKDDDRHFCSGVNSPGEVEGLARTAHNVGITCTEIRRGLLEALEANAGPLFDVFVDSGAFSEVDFTSGAPKVVEPISNAAWLERFDVYRQVARAHRSHAFLVAPDCVGDQAETLRRMERFAHVMIGLSCHYGARVIVPVQRGPLSHFEFLVRALLVLRVPKENVVIGIPSRKAATTPAELRALAFGLKAHSVCAPFHLLGMGPRSKGWGPMRGAIREALPEAVIYSDSVSIRSEVGRTNAKGGGARRLTLAQDRARAAGRKGHAIKAAALIELGDADNRAAVQAARRAGWYDPELESAPGVPFLLDDGTPCLNYGSGGPFGEAPEVPEQLELREVAA